MKKIIVPLLILFLLALFLIWAFSPVNDSEVIEFQVKRGESTRRIAINLEEKGIIKSHWLFTAYIFLKGDQTNLKAGNYFLSSGMTVPEIAGIIVSGKKEKVTIAEGLNIREVAEILELPDLADKSPEIFSDEFPFLKEIPEELSLEGYLFPDTYDITPGLSSEEVVKIILKNFEKKTKDLSYEKTLFEIITMASLIEKEVRKTEDKKIVSGILWKRMGVGMPLQVDATIAYITGKRTTKISIEETRTPSPYNTYLNRGLPIGPISNPGLESIEAALNPKESDYWYYLSKPDGETVFSKNFQEHVEAKRRYLTN